MKIHVITFSLTLGYSISMGQDSIPLDIVKLSNHSIHRIGHRPPNFSVDEKVLKTIRGNRKKYSNYFLDQLPDTSKTIVAHLLLVKMYRDTVSVGEKTFINEGNLQSGFDFSMNGLKFRKYLTGKYLVDIESMRKVRDKWLAIVTK
ncbi:MAG: hypothetical protein HYZ44_17035 [Bacteroidetes bacterium]|nr:hypothetical protein [Bacteroidota bacterium]